MSPIRWLEKHFSRFAIPNLTIALIAGQALLYIAAFAKKGEGDPLEIIRLSIPKVMEGQAWRLFSFVFTPPATSVIIFALIAWSLMHMFGTILEQRWGAFRYNLYLLVSYFANLAVAFILWFGWNIPWEVVNVVVPGGTHAALFGTLFLGAARTVPDMTLNLFFILPVRLKWLGLLTWLMYGYALVFSRWPFQLVILASTLNYFLFFGRDHLRDLTDRKRKRDFQAKSQPKLRGPMHECLVCGMNSNQAPRIPFRYCSQCEGQACYCPEHIGDHEHLVSESTADA
ncbi:rhomboid family intramembrane serine protease [Adhaeretor mobilis]|uniref:Peptidase S54 rhomboid domain-containing protein n=1 Tax=Adhaeretor mobilis TaxID=1930276 RepID=A0A517MZ94_9BACT|nr:rhomboid family intramembrane serine protease [Adhaeretor mobilis]QDT00185.1 hypothetical protein HG15A2_35200 [Adhaeretor mobilis]